jgi:hypothetical protein
MAEMEVVNLKMILESKRHFQSGRILKHQEVKKGLPKEAAFNVFSLTFLLVIYGICIPKGVKVRLREHQGYKFILFFNIFLSF